MERNVFSTNGMGEQDNSMPKNETIPLSYTVYKNECRNIRPETIKYIKENTGKKLCNIGFCDVFVDLSPATKENANN